MIFHENRLLAGDSQEISYLFFSKIRKDVAEFVVCCRLNSYAYMSKEWLYAHAVYVGSKEVCA